ncbi:MAG: putative lipid II flippase MurJ [Firmicutes bacterium]|nr:putative lipid II flippase MurJ [candidate division NPL-UPA2 bacterium]MBT9156385.1 putative lipid II flippase MurJ [candidate division NPL-UPA2 bacterium]
MTDKHAIFRAAFWLSVLSVLSKLLGFVREQAIAWRFGIGTEVDAYVAAMAVPQILAGIIGGLLATTFLPIYSEERARGRGATLSGTTFSASALLSLLASLAAIAFAPQLVRLIVGNFPPAQQALTVQLLRILAFGTLLMSLSQFLTILFNGHQSFLLPGLNPVVQNIIIVAGLLAFVSTGILPLAWYTMVGMAIPVLLLIGLAVYNRYPLLTRPNFTDPAFTKVLVLAAPMLLSALFGQAYLVVDRRLASGLDTGSLAALSFANRLVQLPLGIFVTALATAVYPALTDFAARGDKVSFGKATSASLRGLFLLMLPATVGLIVLRYPVVRLAFERGYFDADATTKTAFAMAYYAVGLLGLSIGQVLVRAFYALQDTVTPVKVGIATTIVSIALAVTLVVPLAHGGLALATSLGALFSAGLSLYLLSNKLGRGKLRLGALVPKVVLASAAMGVATDLCVRLLAPLGDIIALGGAVGVGLGVYGLLLLVLKVEEVDQGIAFVLRRLKLRRT